MKKFGIINYILVFILCVTLICISFFSIINKNFKDAPSAYSFFNKANVFVDLSTLIRLEIQNNYPTSIQNNIILTGLANKLVEVVVSPQLISKVAKPSIELSYAFAQGPTELLDDKVVLLTAPYKQEASTILSGFDLPKFILVNADLIIDSVPPQLTIVNLEKHPNSVLGLILKARGLFEKNKAALDISWVVLAITLTVFVLHGIRHVQKLVQFVWLGFGFAGGFIVLVSVVIPWVLRLISPSDQDSMVLAQHNLISNVIAALLKEVRDVSFIYLGLAVVFFCLWKFVNWNKTQVKINKGLKKIHIPTISVEIKS